MTTKFVASLLGLLMLLMPGAASGQLIQGTLAGYVVDPTQAAVANAKITVRNTDTNQTRETVSNDVGGYTLPTLPPGPYALTINAPGFRPHTQTGIAVAANNVTRVDATLALGQAADTVTVAASISTLQTDRADVRTDISGQALRNLPVPLGRNYQMLLPLIVPGVSTPSSGGSFAANPSRAVSIGFNGASGWGNNTRIDGTSASNFNGTYPMFTPALEAIETVSVITNSFDAEQGMASAVAIQILTKSGTNQLHGSLFAVHTNQHLKAYAWTADRTRQAPKYIHNQLGGTFGGALKKDKAFYFVSYEGTFARQSTPLFAQVPTASMKSGDLSASPTAIFDPSTGAANGTGRTAFPGNQIPVARVDLGIQALLNTKLWPDPNVRGTGAFGLGRNYFSEGTSGQDRGQFDAKLNWNPLQRLALTVRFGLNRNNWFNPQQFGTLGGPGYSPSNSTVGVGEGSVYNGTLSGSYTFTPNLIMDAYFGYSGNFPFSRQQRLDENLGWTLLKIPGLQSNQAREGGWPALIIDGFGGTGAGQLPSANIGPNNNFQPQEFQNFERELVGNATWVRGTHSFRAGTTLVQQRGNENQMQATFCGFCLGSGGFQFSQGATQLSGGPAGNDFNAFGSFLLGLPANAGKVTLFPDEYRTHGNIYGLYVRDQWQVTRKLTLTYGTRWEAIPYATRGDRGLEYLDAAANQMVICGVANNPRNCGITKNTSRFAPRGGIAYRLTDSTVIRAGYGLSNDPTPYGAALGNRQNYPDILATTLNAPNGFGFATTLRQGLPAAVTPNLSSGRVNVPRTAGVFTVDNANFVRGYVQSWNATIEQRIKGWNTAVGYVATRSTNPVSALNLNWSPIGTGAAGQQLNVLAGRTAITNTIGSMGTHRYDSLQAKVERRFAKGMQFLMNYTLAQAKAYSSQVAIPSLFSLNYGPMGNIAKHTVGLSGALEAPFGKNKKWLTTGLAGKALGGWQASGGAIVRTGTPFTVTAANTTLNAVASNQFGDCISAPKNVGSIYQWYDRSSFAVPAAGRFGTCKTNSLTGPSWVNIDAGIDRTFSLRDRIQLKFRAEVFNLANTPHHSNPTNSVNSGTFMQALGIANTGREGIDERVFRLNLRIGW